MTSSAPRVPPNLFGIALGLAGLADAWVYAVDALGAPVGAGDALALLAAATLVTLIVAYVRQGRARILADARDPAVGPFLAAPVLAAFLLVVPLAPDAPAVADAIVIVLLAAGLLLGGWLTGQWMTGGIATASFGPTSFLPTLGMGFLGSRAASATGLHSLAQVYFGIAVVGWVFLSPIVLGRLFFGPPLPAAVTPTLAIELAPPALAGTTYFLLHPGPPDAVALGLAGYAAVMVVAQIRLIPLYRALDFAPAFWSFAFPCAAMVTYALQWLVLERPPGGRLYGWILLTAVTCLVAAIAVRTIVAGLRGQLLPAAGGRLKQRRAEA